MRKARSTAKGVERTEAQETIATSTIASRKPTSGDSTMAITVLDNPLQTTAERPALATPAPNKPPINACDEDDGMPSAHVTRFQTMAPTSAAKITWASTIAGSMIPVPTVCATCSPNTVKATKLKNAAQNTAYCGRSTRVETIVAIELAASCSPFRKSNSSATAMSPNRTGRPSAVSKTESPALNLFDHDRVDLVGDVVEAIRHLLQMVIDLRADDEVHRIRIAMLEKQLLQADVVEIVHAPFKLGHLLGDLGQQRHVLPDRLQQRQRPSDEIGAFDQQRSHFPHRGFEGSDLEQDHGLRGLLHLVDGVVHRGDQILDVAAIERRDEGAADRGQHLAGDIVGVVLELVDALEIDQGFLPASQNALDRVRALHDRLGVAGEKLEKTVLLREKSTKTIQHLTRSMVWEGRSDGPSRKCRISAFGRQRTNPAGGGRSSTALWRSRKPGKAVVWSNCVALSPLSPRPGQRVTRSKSDGTERFRSGG